MSQQNYYFSEILNNDKLPFEASPAIEQRLMYHFQLKHASAKSKRSRKLSFFEILFSSRFVGIKIGFATLLISIAIGFNQFNEPKATNLQADTSTILSAHDSISYNLINDSVAVN